MMPAAGAGSSPPADLDRLVGRVRAFAAENCLFGPGDRVVAGVSGGPDSLTLLYVLVRVVPDPSGRVAVAYLDHGLRGGAGAEEAAFVRGLAERWGLTFFTDRVDTAAHRRARGLSLEAAARELRYRFLGETARRFGATRVAVGHTASDQVETVLLNITRGTGLAGLRGMRPASPYPLPEFGELTLIRPLLRLFREETVAACRALGLEPREDPMNLDRRYPRNRIRLDVLPALRQVNPRVDLAVLRLAEAAAADLGLIEAQAEAALAEALVSASDSELVLRRDPLIARPEPLRAHIFRLALLRLGAGEPLITAYHLERLVRLAAGRVGTRLDLPGGLKARVDYDVVRVGRELGGPADFPAVAGAVRFAPPARVLLDGWVLEAVVMPRPADWDPRQIPDRWTVFLDFDKVIGDLEVRPWQAGDVFVPLGLSGRKKLQDLFTEAKVPRDLRRRWPVLTDRAGIIWVAGLRLADRVKVTPETRRLLRVRLCREQGERGA